MHEFCEFQDIEEPLSRVRHSNALHHGGGPCPLLKPCVPHLFRRGVPIHLLKLSVPETGT